MGDPFVGDAVRRMCSPGTGVRDTPVFPGLARVHDDDSLLEFSSPERMNTEVYVPALEVVLTGGP